METEDLEEPIAESAPVRCLMVIPRQVDTWIWNANENARPKEKNTKHLGLQAILQTKGKKELKYEEGVDWEHKRSQVRDMKNIVKLGGG